MTMLSDRESLIKHTQHDLHSLEYVADCRRQAQAQWQALIEPRYPDVNVYCIQRCVHILLKPLDPKTVLSDLCKTAV